MLILIFQSIFSNVFTNDNFYILGTYFIKQCSNCNILKKLPINLMINHLKIYLQLFKTYNRL
jgi:hypothetical protein